MTMNPLLDEVESVLFGNGEEVPEPTIMYMELEIKKSIHGDQNYSPAELSGEYGLGFSVGKTTDVRVMIITSLIN